MQTKKEIEKEEEGLKYDSYLFGTIHVSCDASLDDSTIKALKTTEQLF